MEDGPALPLRAAELDSAQAERLAQTAAFGHAHARPALSAHIVITPAQATGFVVVTVALAGFGALSPQAAFDVLCEALVVAFALGLVFRLLLALIGGPTSVTASPEIDDAVLPVYTILVPMLREADVLPRLARALLTLDYPRDRLDIKLIVEADDAETLAMAREIARRGPFEVIIVPRGKPQTKPRACNYALSSVPFFSELREAA